jgi:hypothetical protein
MTDLGNRYALSALKAKRAELAGEITVLKRKLDWAETSLRHIDASLNILDPSGDPTLIPAKRPQKRVKLFRQGQLGAMIIGALRASQTPLSTAEVVRTLMVSGRLVEAAKTGLQPRVRSNLAYLQKQNRVSKIGKSRDCRWGLKK